MGNRRHGATKQHDQVSAVDRMRAVLSIVAVVLLAACPLPYEPTVPCPVLRPVEIKIVTKTPAGDTLSVENLGCFRADSLPSITFQAGVESGHQ